MNSNKHIKLSHWQIKRALLNIAWALINVTFLATVTTRIIGTDWQLFWFVGVLIYASFYWIVASHIFDALIGDEIDGKNLV